MRCFFKYFAITLVVQIILLSFILLTAIGESIMYFFYILPFIFVRFLLQGPHYGKSVEISFFVLLGPAAVGYSIIFSAVACLIGWIRNNYFGK